MLINMNFLAGENLLAEKELLEKATAINIAH